MVGATGYTGRELVDLLLDHPDFVLEHLTSRTFSGRDFASVYPEFTDRLTRVCEPLDPPRLNAFDVVFLCLPHGKSMEIVPEVDLGETRVVDLAADYRFSDASSFEGAHGLDHTHPDGVPKAVYGLTEYFSDEICGASLVANPGCYSTASLVPLLPLVREGLIEGPVYVDAKSGISGAGRTPSERNTFVVVNEDVIPYRVGEHHDEPEICQFLPGISLTFVPHVIPADRGIEAAVYAHVDDADGAKAVEQRIHALCDEHALFRFQDSPAGIKAVARTPYCDLSVVTRDRTVVIFSCLDNLRKGAASQAIQNANLQFGFPVERGLLPA